LKRISKTEIQRLILQGTKIIAKIIPQCLFFCDLVYMLLNDKTFIAALFTMDAIQGQDRLIIG
jgi:hypothetical protein